jgi:hypothetical protein
MREQLADYDMEQLLQEMEAGQCPVWKDIADHSSTYITYCAQWKSLVVREDILEQLGDRGTNTAKTVIHAAR